jgi:hypothetical protein
VVLLLLVLITRDHAGPSDALIHVVIFSTEFSKDQNHHTKYDELKCLLFLAKKSKSVNAEYFMQLFTIQNHTDSAQWKVVWALRTIMLCDAAIAVHR